MIVLFYILEGISSWCTGGLPVGRERNEMINMQANAECTAPSGQPAF